MFNLISSVLPTHYIFSSRVIIRVIATNEAEMAKNIVMLNENETVIVINRVMLMC